MIQWMHQLSQSWLATLLMGGLALSFVVWGIADVFTGQTATSVATVGSTEIDTTVFQRAYRNFIRNQSQQMGMEITPDMAEKMGLGDTALQQMVSRTALDNEVKALHLTTSDAALRGTMPAMQAFQGANGQFDHDCLFLRAIQGAGYNEQDFLNEMRADMTREQLDGAQEQGFALPDGYAQALFTFVTEKRAADYVIVSPDAVAPSRRPTRRPWRLMSKRIPSVSRRPNTARSNMPPSGRRTWWTRSASPRRWSPQDYEAHKATYQIPEKRDIQQIEFATEADAQAARAKLDGGESFDAAGARSGRSSPPISMLGEPGQDAIWAIGGARRRGLRPAREGEVSQPVKGALAGYVLMRVAKIVPGVSRTRWPKCRTRSARIWRCRPPRAR